MQLGQPRSADGLERALERGIVLGREADDHVGGEVEVGQRLQLPQVRVDRVAARHRLQDAVVAGLERDVQVRPDHRRLSQCGHELVVDMVDLDRRETQPLDALDRTGRSDQVGEPHPGGAVAEAAEIDAGEDDLAVALRHPLPDLAEDGLGAPRAGRAAHERDHAERARERAAVLDLHEGANAVELRLGLNTADRTDVAGHGLDCLLDLARNDGDVRGKPREGGLGEPGTAAGHVHAGV